jgi:hypothetical protein
MAFKVARAARLSESCSGTVVGIVVNAWRTAGVRLPKDTGRAEKSSKKMNLSAAQWIYGHKVVTPSAVGPQF